MADLRWGQSITGSVTAMDVNSGKVVGKYDMDYPNLGGLLATKGGLIFTAHPDGKVVALDSDNLKELWSLTPIQVLMHLQSLLL